jgi:predicted DNA-binding transcriptional regulator AlpA
VRPEERQSMRTHELPGGPQPVLLTQKQSAAYLNVSYSTFRRWRSLADFPKPFVIGRIFRWLVADLERYITTNLSKGVV